jgi:outer membrane receptor protein involved in Fe transport
MNKNNINLPDYSTTTESGVKYWFKFILFLFIIFYFIYQKKYIYRCMYEK